MPSIPDTVNNVESLIGNLRRGLIAELDLPPHVKINLHEREPVFEQHLGEFLAFSELMASKNSLAATKQLSTVVEALTRIARDQANTGRQLLSLTWALAIFGAGTLAAVVATLLYLSGHF